MANENVKVIYMGTPDFAVPPLKMLCEEGYNVSLVLTQPDKARDRGKKIQPTPVKEAALEAGIEVLQPEKVKTNEDLIERLKIEAPDIIIVAAYGKILPKAILDIPKHGCVNIHASLLPRFRGAAPIQRAIMSGDEKTGISLMYMGEGLDTGDVIAVSELEIGKMTTEELHDRLSAMGSELLREYMPKIIAGDINPIKQDDSLATYAPMIEKTEGHIDFSKDAALIECLVRGMPAKPGAYAYIGDVQMKIREAGVLLQDAPAGTEPGTVLKADNSGIYIACGSGQLIAVKIQMPGKKAMNAGDYLRGNKIESGTVLK